MKLLDSSKDHNPNHRQENFQLEVAQTSCDSERFWKYTEVSPSCGDVPPEKLEFNSPTGRIDRSIVKRV